jgi:hypothetical protein
MEREQTSEKGAVENMSHKHASADDIENHIRQMVEGEKIVIAANIGDALTEKFCGCCIYCAISDFLDREGWG